MNAAVSLSDSYASSAKVRRSSSIPGIAILPNVGAALLANAISCDRAFSFHASALALNIGNRGVMTPSRMPS